MTNVAIRKGMPATNLSKQEFRARFCQRFADPAFNTVRADLERVVEVAWDGYTQCRKAPQTQAAGAEFADPGYELSVAWLEAREAIKAAAEGHYDPAPTVAHFADQLLPAQRAHLPRRDVQDLPAG